MTDDQAAPAADQGSRNLFLRVMAALILAPAAIAIAWLGVWLWTTLVTLAAIGLYVEWLMIVGMARETRVVTSGAVALAVSGLCFAAGRIDASLLALALGLAAVALLAPQRRSWTATGFFYAAAAQMASELVRLDQTYGFVALMLVLLVVWVTDIGGYFAGRGIGGPKLWPRVSPRKTWAGAVGGFAASLVVAAGFAAFGLGKTGPLLLLGAVLSIASQLGDLFESAVKRRFGVKDSSHIIPGHGGLMDRLDGFVAAVVAAAIFGFCGVAWMASAAVLWFGEGMSAVPLRNSKAAASAVRAITVLGATGSIGDSTMDLLRASRDRYQVEALTAHTNVQGLAKLAKEFGARFAAIADPGRLGELKDALAGTGIECGAGESAVIEAAARPADWVMAAVSGAAGLKPALAAVDRGATVALANKECLVCAGDFFMQRAAKAGACILPADSEHNALFQALGSGNREELVRVIITASGGPFRTWAIADIEQATLAQALKHPNWSMGQKITIDSASMMNKGLEVIEASYLFALTPDEIDVLVHPQSIIHGMVEFSDRSVVAQLGAPDMRTPIAHCLGWPDRIVGPATQLDLAKIGQLTFEAPDFDRFPALRLAYDALRTGRGATTVYNAANEVAVAAFIGGKIKFGAIARLVEATMDAWIRSGNLAPMTSADDAIAVDHNARNKAATLLPQIALKAS